MTIIPNPAAPAAPLTAAQQSALKKLHTASQQLEGVFVDMLFKEMRNGSPDVSITGKVSESEKTWNEMLDQARADQLAKSGSLGIARMIEAQMRASVLATAKPAVTPGRRS